MPNRDCGAARGIEHEVAALTNVRASARAVLFDRQLIATGCSGPAVNHCL